jgi:hypothetical protein
MATCGCGCGERTGGGIFKPGHEPRRIATRYEKLAIQYLAMLYVGLIERYLSMLFANTA